MKEIRECPKDERWDFIQAAVLKATSTKPKIKEKDWGSIRKYEVCPSCENVVIYDTPYCEKCGQHIDWGEIK